MEGLDYFLQNCQSLPCLLQDHLRPRRLHLLHSLLPHRLLDTLLDQSRQLATVDRLRVEPQLEFEPIEDIEYGEGELEEAERKPGQSNGDIRVELCLLILDDNPVEHGDVEADKDGEGCCDPETIVHVFLGYLLCFLEVVTVLDLLLHAVGVA